MARLARSASALAAVALLAACAAAVPVEKCEWTMGACNASPATIVWGAGLGYKPTSPMAEGMLRTYALEAGCAVYRDEKECAADKTIGCKWFASVKPSCMANGDAAYGKLDDLPSLTGCPGSIAAALPVCNAAQTREACARVGSSCGWVEESDLKALEKKAAEMSAAKPDEGIDVEPEITGPNGGKPSGCVPSALAALVVRGDVLGVDKMNDELDEDNPKVYGSCEVAASNIMSKCSNIEAAWRCKVDSNCDWDAEEETCSARQSAVLAALLGANSRAVVGAKACAALKSESACQNAGTIDLDSRLPAAYLALQRRRRSI